MTGKSLIVRYACDGVNPASKSTEITVPTRNSAPVPSIDTKTELLTATGTYPEYWTGEKWSALVFIGLDVSGLCGKEISVRESFDAEHFASLPVTVKVPGRGEKPDIAIDRDKQTIDTTPGMEYSTDGGKTWNPISGPLDVSDLTGNDILVRYPSDGTDLPGESTTIKIPVRRKAPDVGHTDETRLVRNDGTLTETDRTKVTIEKGKDTGGTGSKGNNGNNNLTGSKTALLNRKDHMSYISSRTATQAAPGADITSTKVIAILARFCDTSDNSGADYFTDISSTR